MKKEYKIIINGKTLKFGEPELSVLLDALWGQILGIERDCIKFGKKICRLLRD